ncbi:MAG: multidrug transporter EmrE-like cation transporter [Alphaproteobacteria bacterium]|jgi:multidrug transporter EmrE-like cation transporter
MTATASWYALFVAITLTAVAQVLLKAGSRPDSPAGFPLKLLGLGTLGIVTILMVLAMQGLPLRTVTAWTGLTFVLVPLAARLFLKERLSRRTMLASVVIVIGIVLFSSGG